MSGKSQIQWTERTWNPVTGCTRVSPGCDHCYAFQLHDQRHIAWKRGRWPAAPMQYHTPFSQVQLLPERLDKPLRWRKPRRVFVNSMSDLFHPSVPDEFIDRVFAVMCGARQHTFQVLTKRPERMLAWMQRFPESRYGRLMVIEPSGSADRLAGAYLLPAENVWLGVSVENQQAADERIPLLLETPAAVRFLSCEPLLGPVDLLEYIAYLADVRAIAHYQRTGHLCGGVDDQADCEICGAEWRDGVAGLNWVIIGGESGPHAREMEMTWARSLIEQCQESGVAVFVKQLGSVWSAEARIATGKRYDPHGGDPSEWPEYFRIREFPAVREAVMA